MSLEIISCSSREEWLKEREKIHGIGGSEAGAVCGFSKWTTTTQLWEEKTGRRQPKDLSGISYVEMGVRAEGPMRDLFAALHPEYEVRHFPFDMLYQADRPWLFATLDGELTDIATGEKGILEIKKFDIQSKKDWQEWDGQVPQNYFCQVLHQMLATGWDFAWLWALLLRRDGSATLRPYYFPREDHGEDLAWLLDKETKFMGCVQKNQVPPAPLRL